MFTQKPPSKKTGLEKAIDDLLLQMTHFSGEDAEYATMVKQLSKLYALKEIDHTVETRTRVSRDTLFIVGGNIIGILLIVGHERANVVTSKALQLLMKLK